MNLGKNIDDRCKQLGISIKELSELSGVHYTTLRDIVADKSSPSIDKVKNIAFALHTTIDRNKKAPYGALGRTVPISVGCRITFHYVK